MRVGKIGGIPSCLKVASRLQKTWMWQQVSEVLKNSLSHNSCKVESNQRALWEHLRDMLFCIVERNCSEFVLLLLGSLHQLLSISMVCRTRRTATDSDDVEMSEVGYSKWWIRLL